MGGEKLKQLLSGRAVDVCILPQAGQDPDYYSVELHRADVFIVAKSGCFDKVCPDHAARDIDVREIADMPILAPPEFEKPTVLLFSAMTAKHRALFWERMTT